MTNESEEEVIPVVHSLATPCDPDSPEPYRQYTIDWKKVDCPECRKLMRGKDDE